jgi:hypothetical protein
MWRTGMFIVFLTVFVLTARAQTAPSPDRRLPGLDAFPVAVWLQSPSNITAYKNIGINTYVGLWEGPTDKQLAPLQKAGMKVICDQNAEALKPQWKNTVLAFMHGDEPDNAQELPGKKGYGPPILPAKIVTEYKTFKAADPRPVMLNLGQGVAWDGYIGRGTRTNKPEDYAQYVQGADIANFDIYPACHDNKEIAGKLQYVGTGAARLKTWASPRPVWACIETTRISNLKRKVTPDEMHSEVWIAIANGATGIIYFAHQFQPTFIEAGLLADKDIAAMVKSTNEEVQSLAGPLLEGTDAPEVKVESTDKDGVKLLARRWKNATYIILVGMSAETHKVTITVPKAQKLNPLQVGMVPDLVDGTWHEDLKGYAVRFYRIPN